MDEGEEEGGVAGGGLDGGEYGDDVMQRQSGVAHPQRLLPQLPTANVGPPNVGVHQQTRIIPR